MTGELEAEYLINPQAVGGKVPMPKSSRDEQPDSQREYSRSGFGKDRGICPVHRQQKMLETHLKTPIAA